MVGCELLDFRCTIVNELIGSTVLAGVMLAILYFVFASKFKIGFRTTMSVTVILLLITSSIMGLGFNVVYPFAAVFIGLLLATIFQKITGNQGFI